MKSHIPLHNLRWITYDGHMKFVARSSKYTIVLMGLDHYSDGGNKLWYALITKKPH